MKISRISQLTIIVLIASLAISLLIVILLQFLITFQVNQSILVIFGNLLNVALIGGLVVGVIGSICIAYLFNQMLHRSQEALETSVALRKEQGNRARVEENERNYHRLADTRAAQLEVLLSTAESINQAISLETILNPALKAIATRTNARVAWILSIDQKNQPYILATYDPRNVIKLTLGEKNRCPSCSCAAKLLAGEIDKPKQIHDCEWLIQSESRFAEINRHMVFPLRSGKKYYGLLNLIHDVHFDNNPEEVRLINAICSQISVAIERTSLFDEVKHTAPLDPLTGMYNRYHFFDYGRKAFSLAKRYAHPLAIIMMDIDHFKEINDAYGHAAGEQVLRFVAAACQQCLRSTDLVGRFSDEEFVILLPQTKLEGAIQTATRIQELVIPQEIILNEGQVSARVSIGIGAMDTNCATLDKMVERADKALKYAKAKGQDRIEVWSEEIEKDQDDYIDSNIPWH
jgi:diguanylate cyclase (GGDEF)-like protein